jgi:hypothetical protein
MSFKEEGVYQSPLFLEIKERYLKGEMSAKSLHDSLGGRASLDTIRKYIKLVLKWAEQQGLDLPVPKPASRVPISKPISGWHHGVGLKLLQFRLVDLPRQNGRRYTVSEFSTVYNIGNRQSLPLMETGKYDFTLSEIIKIAGILQIPLQQLMTLSGTQRKSA